MDKTLPGRELTVEQPGVSRLVVFEPGAAPRVVRMHKVSVTFGRGDAADVVLADGRASGVHARVRRRRDTQEYEVVDLESSNGTFVDGKRVERALVGLRCVMRFGDTLVVLESGAIGRGWSDPTTSQAAAVLREELEQAGRSDTPVLLLGPTGAGKGWAARAIADGGRRGPFVHVNCAALPRDLVESELFGAVPGAYTGAIRGKDGLIESAAGGTLFLDEIGEIPPEVQAKLLTVIEDKQVRKLGATRETAVDFRVIAATNLDVARALDEGTFRRDLYFRLSAHEVDLPPLTARAVDVPRLLEIAPERCSPEALEALLVYAWPGNIRELLQLRPRLSGSGAIDYHDLPDRMTAHLAHRTGAQGGTPPRDELEAVLDETDGNVSAAARQLGVHRNQLVRWLDAYGLRG
jgi:DNA-binding NtrC family response regulator